MTFSDELLERLARARRYVNTREAIDLRKASYRDLSGSPFHQTDLLAQGCL